MNVIFEIWYIDDEKIDSEKIQNFFKNLYTYTAKNEGKSTFVKQNRLIICLFVRLRFAVDTFCWESLAAFDRLKKKIYFAYVIKSDILNDKIRKFHVL